jgi:glutathione S-transferase
MITVYKFASAWGQPDLSPFVVKLETYLRMASIEYKGVRGDVRKAPKKKLPYVDHDGRLIGDSSFIIEHFKGVFGDPLDEQLGSQERAVAASFQAMLEEHFYFVILYQRWQEERGWEKYGPVLREVLGAAGIPGPLRGAIATVARKGILRSLQAQGTGRHAQPEVEAIGTRIVQSISDWMGERSFFLGSSPSTVDATVYAFLRAVMDVPLVTATKTRAEGLPNLRPYVTRMTERYWAS